MTPLTDVACAAALTVKMAEMARNKKIAMRFFISASSGEQDRLPRQARC
jgi:hypothetical protein